MRHGESEPGETWPGAAGAALSSWGKMDMLAAVFPSVWAMPMVVGIRICSLIPVLSVSLFKWIGVSDFA